MPSPARRDLARVSWLPFECRRLRGVGWAHDRGAGWAPDRGAGGPPCRLRHDATWLVSLGCHSSAGDSVAWGWASDRGAGWAPDRGAGGPPCRLRHDATWLVSLRRRSSAGDSVAPVRLMTVACGLA